MSKKYPQVYEGDWVQPKRRGYKAMCCDCGLIHRYNFRLVESGNGGKTIQFQVFRENRATAATRRGAKTIRVLKK